MDPVTLKGESASQLPYLDCGVLEEGVLMASLHSFKEGVFVFWMNEHQADKLCEESQRRQTAEHTLIHLRNLDWIRDQKFPLVFLVGVWKSLVTRRLRHFLLIWIQRWCSKKCDLR